MAFFQRGAERACCREKAAMGPVGAQPPQPSQVACEQGTTTGEHQLKPNGPLKAGKLMATAAALRGCAGALGPLLPTGPQTRDHPPRAAAAGQGARHKGACQMCVNRVGVYQSTCGASLKE